ncbi:uncharacterized protein LOC125553122 isoform X1 [Triticum urartu]|uniref:uncharacterized protein LOC125553122 isoform X1 n=1 Tax=Triticum urartu TaxID=4572 RepID=UPI002044119E|nr:uncharacterized protein LOC125553122 isoform X1 [Triticum urartu]
MLWVHTHTSCMSYHKLGKNALQGTHTSSCAHGSRTCSPASPASSSASPRCSRTTTPVSGPRLGSASWAPRARALCSSARKLTPRALLPVPHRDVAKPASRPSILTPCSWFYRQGTDQQCEVPVFVSSDSDAWMKASVPLSAHSGCESKASLYTNIVSRHMPLYTR